MKKVFVDGSTGTTGLNLLERLTARQDIQIISLPQEHLKDLEYKREAMNQANIVFLCLPNEAALLDAELVENKTTAIIDASSVHRCMSGWTYGFPELKGQREQIQHSLRIANPGCHASGFIALIAPLIQASILSSKTKLSCFSLTGYSSHGKKAIAIYESEERDRLISGARLYTLRQNHKHLDEMCYICGLETKPILCPVLNPYYSGIEVIIPLFVSDLTVPPKEIEELYRDYYRDSTVKFRDNPYEDGFLSSLAYSGRDDMEICVKGNDDRITLIARYDNLGKGSCGAAIQNMNLLLGIDEFAGLVTFE